MGWVGGVLRKGRKREFSVETLRVGKENRHIHESDSPYETLPYETYEFSKCCLLVRRGEVALMDGSEKVPDPASHGCKCCPSSITLGTEPLWASGPSLRKERC